MSSWRKDNRKNVYNNNRINLIMAIIFLLFGSVLFKLYSLQVAKYDLYIAMASDQHQVFSQLKPERGKIFIQDGIDNNIDSELHPIATNKNFALVYSIPKMIKHPKDTAEKLCDIFDKEKIEKEVEELLKNLEESGMENFTDEFREIKKEAEINLRMEACEEEYLKKLTKENDPYEPIAKKVDEEVLKKIEELNLDGISYTIEENRFYPENNIGSHLVGFVGYVGDEQRGRYGLEGFFDEELYGKFGSIKADKSAVGGVVIINDREYSEPHNGSDFVLTINRSIQFAACQKLNEAAEKFQVESGSVIIMNPDTGAILAMCSWPDYDPNNYKDVSDISVYNNPAIFHQYEPGSIFKPITMAAAIDKEKITPQTTYKDEGSIMIEGWDKPIKNSDFESNGGHGVVDMNTVLEESLNTGAIFAMEQIGAKDFAEYIKNFGFGEKTGIELETEGPGDISNLLAKKIKPVDAAVATFGQGITATALQMISSYATIANGGMLVKPYLVKEIIHKDGSRITTQPKQIRRVISERAAVLTSGMLVNVVESGHAKQAGVRGYYVAGKTGTAQVADKEKRGYGDKTIHTFVGFAPVEDPKFVMLVKLDDPKVNAFSASTAAPLFGDIAEFVLNYYQVPKER
ncbi:MAG: penicillin-binding protein 2 [Candidatus Falkowbacteria bacterium]